MLRDEYGQRLPRAIPPVQHVEPYGYRDEYATRNRADVDCVTVHPVRHVEPIRYKDAYVPEDRYHDVPAYPPREPLPWKWITLTAFFVLVVIGMGVAIGYLVEKGADGGSAAPCTEVTVESSMRFNELEYSDALKDKTSPEYAEFVYHFCKDLSSGLVKDTSVNQCGKTNDVCDVSSLSAGSIYVNFIVKAYLSESEAKIERSIEELTQTVTDAIETTIIEGRAGPDEENIFKNTVSEIVVEISATEPVAQCPDLFIPEGATVLGQVQGASYAGDNIIVRCNPGFRVFGDEKDQYLKCRPDGTWDQEITACLALQCPEIKDLENKVILEGGPTGNQFKDTVVTKCEEGYSLDINDVSVTMSYLVCQEDGLWDQELPECHALLCPEVTLPRNTVLESGSLTDNMFNNQITLKCGAEMEFEDGTESQTWTCNKYGEWDKDFKGCEPTRGQWSEWSDYGECRTKCSGETVNRTRLCINPPESASEVQLPCEGDLDIEYQLCSVDNTCASMFAAFTAKSEATTADVDIVFDEVQVDKTDAFLDGTHFTAQEEGVYMFSLSAGAVDGELMKLQLTTDDGNGIGTIGVEKYHRTEYADTISRDVLIFLTKGTRVRVVLLSGFTTGGLGIERLTSLSIFSYSGLMKEGGAAFTSGMAEDVVSVARYEPVFKDVRPQFNFGNGFVESSGYFVAPYAGIYFFSVTSVGDESRRFLFDCVGKCESNGLGLEGADYDGYSLSRSFLFDLDMSDSFAPVQDTSGSKTYLGSNNIDSSFSGFLYDPLLVEPVAFFAVHTELDIDLSHEMNPVYFTEIFVDVGSSFIASSLIVRVPGIYYIHYTQGIYDSITLYQFWLMKNDEKLNGMKFNEEMDGSESVMARSAIVELQVGDVVYLKADKDTYFYSDGAYGSVSFLGLLLQ